MSSKKPLRASATRVAGVRPVLRVGATVNVPQLVSNTSLSSSPPARVGLTAPAGRRRRQPPEHRPRRHSGVPSAPVEAGSRGASSPPPQPPARSAARATSTSAIRMAGCYRRDPRRIPARRGFLLDSRRAEACARGLGGRRRRSGFLLLVQRRRTMRAAALADAVDRLRRGVDGVLADVREARERCRGVELHLPGADPGDGRPHRLHGHQLPPAHRHAVVPADPALVVERANKLYVTRPHPCAARGR